MLIDSKDESNIQIAITENERLVNFFFESNENESIVRNVYLGIVDHVENSLQAYFINYGGNKNGFLSFSASKENLIKGQYIIVQIVKDEKENKGAMLTTFIEIKSMLMVGLMNQNKGCSVSKKISAKTDRELIKSWYERLDSHIDSHIIFRHSVMNKEYSQVENDIKNINQTMEYITNAAKEKTVRLILKAPSMIEKIITDYYKPDTQIYVEGDIQGNIPQYMSEYANKHNEIESIFKFHNIENQIESIFCERVNLPSGGYIIIQHTEALTSIDVNSGVCKKESSIDKTALLTNMEAAVEITKQLQLRDIGGLIVIDFIDMYQKEYMELVTKKIAKNMENDKAKYNLGELDRFCLFTISRQQLRRNSFISMHRKCLHCEGIGFVKKDSVWSSFVLRQVAHLIKEDYVEKVMIKCDSNLAYYILNHKRDMLYNMENEYNKVVQFEFVQNNVPCIFYEQDNILHEHMIDNIKQQTHDGIFKLPSEAEDIKTSNYKTPYTRYKSEDKYVEENKHASENKYISENLANDNQSTQYVKGKSSDFDYEKDIRLRMKIHDSSCYNIELNKSFTNINPISVDGKVVGYL